MIFTNKSAYNESKMSVNKVKHEYKIILDFTNKKLSKTEVKRSLSDIEIAALYKSEENNLLDDQLICVENEIKVGMYKISIVLPPAIQRNTSHKLKDFGTFRVQIFEDGKVCREINLKRDGRFKEQYWTQKNNCGLKVKDLTDIICHCNRLDNLKAFI
jgi:hypothetical protein